MEKSIFKTFEDILKSHDQRNFANYWWPLLTSEDIFFLIYL